MVVGKLLVAMRNPKIVQPPHKPAGAVEQVELILLAAVVRRRLNEHGIAHRYEELPDNHSGVDYRMDESLPVLAQALSG